MPHIIVKLLAGRTEAQKAALADAVTKAVMTGVNVPETSISVAIEDIEAGRWKDDVYTPDITGHWDKIYKKPGYDV